MRSGSRKRRLKLDTLKVPAGLGPTDVMPAVARIGTHSLHRPGFKRRWGWPAKGIPARACRATIGAAAAPGQWLLTQVRAPPVMSRAVAGAATCGLPRLTIPRTALQPLDTVRRTVQTPHGSSGVWKRASAAHMCPNWSCIHTQGRTHDISRYGTRCAGCQARVPRRHRNSAHLPGTHAPASRRQSAPAASPDPAHVQFERSIVTPDQPGGKACQVRLSIQSRVDGRARGRTVSLPCWRRARSTFAFTFSRNQP
jgi:hypothetical protein